jgi:hypothetical protein
MVPKGLSRVPYVGTNRVRLFETNRPSHNEFGPASVAVSAVGPVHHVIDWCFIC